MKEKRGHRARIIDGAGDKRKDTRRPYLSSTRLNLETLTQPGGTIDKGFRRRCELHHHEHSGRNHSDKRPSTDPFNVLKTEHRRNDENEREMKEIGTNPKSRHENCSAQGVEWEKDDNARCPAEKGDDFERDDESVLREETSAQGQHVDGHHYGIAHE